jgi:hypothetical protein
LAREERKKFGVFSRLEKVPYRAVFQPYEEDPLPGCFQRLGQGAPQSWDSDSSREYIALLLAVFLREHDESSPKRGLCPDRS